MTKLSLEPYYKTDLGAAYLGDSKELMKQIPDESIDLICTSPPFALVRKKEYGNGQQLTLDLTVQEQHEISQDF